MPTILSEPGSAGDGFAATDITVVRPRRHLHGVTWRPSRRAADWLRRRTVSGRSEVADSEAVERRAERGEASNETLFPLDRRGNGGGGGPPARCHPTNPRPAGPPGRGVRLC